MTFSNIFSTALAILENNRVYFKGQLENRINDLKKEQKEANKQLISNIKVASEEKVRKINSGT